MTDEQIIEVLATKGMGYERVTWETIDGELVATPRGAGRVDRWRWNPLADRNAVAEIEARLTEKQQDAYLIQIFNVMIDAADARDSTRIAIGNPNFRIRHASPRVCCEALVEVLTRSESGAQSEPK